VIQHVALEVRPEDVAESVRFWALLGFAEVAPPPALAGRTTWVEREGTQVHLLHDDDPVAPPEGHVAVVATEYDAVLERLRAAGYEPGARPEHWGAPRCFVRSPGGHRVEVMSRPPGACA
jgi:catechol 2,3-dioxygenase-like lactoylglutathione lyase family enzyme